MRLVRAATLALVAFLAAAPAAAAQRVEVGVRAGYFTPTGELFYRISMLPPSSGGIGTLRTEGRNAAGPLLGLNLTAWMGRSLGLDVGTSFSSSNRNTSDASGPTTSISVHTLRLLARTHLGGFGVHLGAGPALVHFDGDSYNDLGVIVQLARQTFVGGVATLDVTRTVGRVPLRLSVEDAMYKPALARLPLGIQPVAQFQHDLRTTVGIAFPVH